VAVVNSMKHLKINLI